ncbi:MAG: tRNA (adenosine(37)-N6)-threonylcarbamoyltransferase complex transferase subunit TsaD, partial [Clostridia bacterium]|nr:tRNA (adenosine(37)-N6)-threonylcarbamoyltransferase complex transferase subunit TsaD [Clostridia bacterium]
NALREEFQRRANEAGASLYLPDAEYCTDNAAMIGCAAGFAKATDNPLELNANASKTLF